MKVPFATLEHVHGPLREEMKNAFLRVYDKGTFIQGEECSLFENEFAEFCKSEHAVGVASGLDALALALRALGVSKSDEVILPSNTFVATALAVSMIGAKVVLVDPDPLTYNMTAKSFEEAITPRTKAVIPVHLYGQAAEIEDIVDVAKRYSIRVVEDCAQAHGALYRGKHVGTFGDIGCFSFYPGKNLGALGDGGATITGDEALAERMRELANYGSKVKYHHVEKGMNSRLDELQAALLRVKLRCLDEHIADRQRAAAVYLENIKNDRVTLPVVGSERNHVWHIFAVRCSRRDEFKRHLEEAGVGVNCHYPITIADQQAYVEDGLVATPLARRLASEELSLPLYVGMTDDELRYVIDTINEFE